MSSSTTTTNNASSGGGGDDDFNAAALESVNNKLLSGNSASAGADVAFPSITLPQGQTVRTGTFATLLHNMRLYDALDARARGDDKADAEAARAEIVSLKAEMRLALPTLRLFGVFELFPPDEWISGGSPGRRLVGALAKEEGI